MTIILCHGESWECQRGAHDLQYGLFCVSIPHVLKVEVNKIRQIGSQNGIHVVKEDHRRPIPLVRDLLDVSLLNYEWIIIWKFSRACTGTNFRQDGTSE